MATQSALNPQTTALTLGQEYHKAEVNVLAAYQLKEGATAAQVKELAGQLGLSKTESEKATVRSLQLIAEQRYQRSSQMINLFSGLMDKVDQLKQRIISKFSN